MYDVDVVIPVRNAVRFLPEAVESVRRQRGAHCRIQIVDDGTELPLSQVLQPDLAAHCRISANTASAGIGGARNHGASLGSAPLVAFLDCDDLWPDDRTQVLGDALRRSGADIAFGMAEQFVDGDAGAFRVPPEPRRGMLAGGMLLRRSCWDAVGGFDEGLPVGEFIDWVSRLRRAGQAETTSDRIVLRRRIHGDNTTVHRVGQRGAYVDVVRRHLRAKEASR